jgi:hypothetical protein
VAHWRGMDRELVLEAGDGWPEVATVN